MHNFSGLTSEQVRKSKLQYGVNVLPTVKSKSWFDFLIEICRDKINIILSVMLFLLMIVAYIGYGSWAEPLGVGIVLIAIFIIGIFTKLKAQKYSMELLNKSSVHFCNVIRNGKIKHINTNDVVVGDFVVLHSGEMIPADGYIISGEIYVNNSVLNGESADCLKSPVSGFKYDNKRKITADDYVGKNLVFSGTTVQSGVGTMIVGRIGVNTENAKTLLTMRRIVETKTDLDIKLEHFASIVTVVGYFCAISFFILMMIIGIVQVGGIKNFFNMDSGIIFHNIILQLTIAVTIVVSAVPEGLPLIISIITAQNSRKMLKHNILAKNTHKIPEAGNIHILCTDKTGTLTYGKLIPTANYLGNCSLLEFNSDTIVGKMITTNIIFNTEAMFDEKNHIVGGNVTQRALLGLINPDSSTYKKLIKTCTVINKLPFNSANKFSVVSIKQNKEIINYYIGAPELILSHTNKYMDIDGTIHKINKTRIKKLLSENASQAKRLVALAYTETNRKNDKIQDNLTLLSLISIRDDVRREVPSAVKRIQGAGIQVIMITGDIIDTARAIAIDSGIITSKDDIIINASEIDNMSDYQLRKMLPKIRVIARATPKTKLRIVQIAQELKLCIGMCGDGTNDAPALRQADVGFAMGSGTDVCKEAGDIIILDDNFVSIVDAVLFGRTFIQNVNKFLTFQLPLNLTMMITCLIYPIFFGVSALTAVQILIINIVTDSLNSLAFGGEPTKSEYMRTNPPIKGAPLINHAMLRQSFMNIFIFTFSMLLLLTPVFQNSFGFSGDKNLSARFAILVIIGIINGFNIRENSTHLLRGITKNPLFILVAISIILLTVGIVNFGGEFFGCTPLNITQWIIIFGIASLIIPIDILRKKLL